MPKESYIIDLLVVPLCLIIIYLGRQNHRVRPFFIILISEQIISSLGLFNAPGNEGEKGFKELSGPAFCERSESSSANQYSLANRRYFPTEQPERHLPWPWEAVYDPIRSEVEVVSISRAACQFNRTTWKYLVKKFPEYRRHFSFGFESNILVHVEEGTRRMRYANFNGQKFICRFYDRFNHQIFETTSLAVKGHNTFSILATFHIRCPIPASFRDTQDIWSHMRLQHTSRLPEFTENVTTDTTGDFPLCKIPRHYQPPTNEKHDNDEKKKKKKRFDLSICTATSRSDRRHLVEWIEYHRLIGVQHFFIYNTALSNEGLLPLALQDFIAEGRVTVVPWPYRNCVRQGMSSGRWFGWMESGEQNLTWFPPPTAIAQTAALDSCYLRFKHTSTYMAHIDDDEFISFSRQAPSSSSLNGVRYPRLLKSLVDYVEHTFATGPKTAPAIYIPPAYIVDCCNHSESCSTLNGLPRLGRDSAAAGSTTHRQLFLPADTHERKLIMKTEAVGAFYVHYITFLMEPDTVTGTRWRLGDAIEANISDATVFHFKMPPSLDRDPFGRLNIRNESIDMAQLRICELDAPELSYNSNEKNNNNNNNVLLYAGIPLQLVRRLERCMKRRMKKKIVMKESDIVII